MEPGTPTGSGGASGSREKTFLDEGGILVTSARFVVGGQTYAMAAVNSVSYEKQAPNTSGSGCAMALSPVVALGGLALLTEREYMPSGVFLIVASAAVFFGAYTTSKKLKPTHIVRLTTSSGQVDGLKTQDEAAARRVVEALNASIVARG